MFIIILALVATLMHGYLTWRVASLKPFAIEHRRLGIWLASLCIWLICIAGIRFGHASGGGLFALLEQLALDWLGILFMVTTIMLVIDVVTGFGLWAKPWLERLRFGALLLAGVMIGVAIVQGNRPPLITRHEVALEGLPQSLDGARVAVLSDLHLGSQFGADWLADRVEQVEGLNPDIIILLGDIFEGHGAANYAELQPIIARLRAPLGVYAVTGNHEFFGDVGDAIAMSEGAGVTWLRNRMVTVVPGLTLVGVDDLSHYFRNDDNTIQVESLLKERPAGVTMLLSHSPLQVESAAAAGTGLMLSGHTHNGQIWPFNYFVQRFYPYITGKYVVGDMTLIVSSGTGLWGPRMRLWKTGEIGELTLKAKPVR